jgi:biotin carboxyl carrier protein
MEYTVFIHDRSYTVGLPDDGSARVNGTPVEAEIMCIHGGEYSALVAGRSFRVVLQEHNGTTELLIGGIACEARVESERDRLLRQYGRSSAHTHHRAEIHAPMPALVVKVEVSVGDEVKEGQGLLILEAMKMENELKAHQAGTVKKILATTGKAVDKGELLMVVE